MDLATIGPLIIGALGALGFIGQYVRGQGRRDRVENRKFRRMILDGDEWMFAQVRRARRQGFSLDPLPKSWEALHEPDDDAPPAVAQRDDAGEQGGGRGSRHALDEGRAP